ncbi:MAG: hypothetical protein HY821_11495 [Acidobacteria bacterium]|nr:hypothetical protein [Acidobacteriota bacterium]
MPVDDLYFVRYLLQSTQPGEGCIFWQEADSGSWRAEINGVKVSLFHTHEMGWSGLCLSLSGSDGNPVYIEEPKPSSFFGRRYRQNDQLLLAEAIRALADAISGQCHSRRRRALEEPEALREALFRKVLFGSP